MPRFLFRIAGLALVVLAASCQQPETSSGSEAPAPVVEAPVAKSSPIVVPESLRESLATRSEQDRSRDAGRKPGEVVTFLGIKPGMTVLDLFAASGWYTEVLARAVGADGLVYAQNNDFLLTMRDGANDKAMAARLADDRFPNVRRLDREVGDLGLEPESVDAAMFALNFHDVYNSAGAEGAAALLQNVYEVLKPGGILGVIDHVGAAGNDNAALHRIEEARVLEVIKASPFSLDAQSDILRNPDDDLSVSVFAPGVRGQTDRFMLRLKK